MARNRRTFRRPSAPDGDSELRKRLRELAEMFRRFGSPRMTILLNREDWAINHKRVERVYREEGLSLRLKRRRKRCSHLQVVMPGSTGPEQRWSLEFVSDTLLNDRRLRLFTVVDAWYRTRPCHRGRSLLDG
jgi:putative transposase